MVVLRKVDIKVDSYVHRDGADMKAADFDYERPKDIAGVLNLLANDDRDIYVLAGGQSLMPMMNFRLAQPELLVDLNAIGELNFIQEDRTRIVIGAMTRYAELAASPLIEEHIPLFNMALPHIAHAAVRNRGTIGGSVALADPAAEMPALLLALNATITVTSAAAERTIAADDFFLGLYETALADNELITSISIPKATSESRFGFYELARRHGDYAMVGVAIAAEIVDPVKDIRIVIFSVSDRAHRLKRAERAFIGKTLNNEEAYENARRELDNFDFHGDLNAESGTKQHLSGVVLKRALKEMTS